MPQCELDKLLFSCSVLDETVLFIFHCSITRGLDINDAVHYDHVFTLASGEECEGYGFGYVCLFV